MSNGRYQIVACATEHPTIAHPFRAMYNHFAFEALVETGAADLEVVSPTPYAPPVGPFSEYWDVPRVENQFSYPLHHPRFWYFLPKSLLYHWSGDSFAKRVPKYVDANCTTPDLVHAHSVFLDGYGMLPYCHRHQIPLIITLHGGKMHNYDDLSFQMKLRIGHTLDLAERVLCVSGPLAEQASRLTDSSKISVVPIGANPTEFPTDDDLSIREDFGIDPETPVALFVGRFEAEKGISEFLTALQRLDVEDAHIVCVGSRGEKERMANVLRSVPYSTQLFLGLPPEVLKRWFAVADLFILPSHEEGRPTVIYEAMASKTAVLASEVGGVPEQVVDGKTGVLIPPKRADLLADRLNELLSDSHRLQEMGERGHERLTKQGWTWSHHAGRLVSIHRDTIGDWEG